MRKQPRWTQLLIMAVSATALGCAGAARTPPPLPQLEPTEGPAALAMDDRDSVGMVAVPAGPFKLGTPPGKLELVYELCRAGNPDPMQAFSIGRTEVTNAQYERCVREGGCTPIDFERCIFFVNGMRELGAGRGVLPPRGRGAPHRGAVGEGGPRRGWASVSMGR
jgi:formylglycine-generating enzyme required for sulfatase activity